MSKFEFFMDDDDNPYLRITGDHDEVISNRDNTVLFLHSPEFNYVDHLYIDVDTAQKMGAFIFRHSVANFDEFVEGLAEAEFPYCWRRDPLEADVEAFERSIKDKPDPRHPSQQVIEARVIEEDEDDEVVAEALAHWDEEWKYYASE